MYIYYPSCNFAISSPQTAKKVREYLKEKMDIAKCCKIDQRKFNEEDIGIYVCQACRGQIENQVNTMSLWQYLDQLDDFKFPDYHGQKMYLQDCWRDRNHPEIHQAVRSLLKKMNIDIIESKYSGTESICCGDNFYPKISIEKISEFQKMRASQMPCKDVVVYCVSCIKSMTIGGKIAHHMADLLLNETTDPQELKIDVYHETLNSYIEKH